MPQPTTSRRALLAAGGTIGLLRGTTQATAQQALEPRVVIVTSFSRTNHPSCPRIMNGTAPESSDRPSSRSASEVSPREMALVTAQSS